MDYLSTTRKTTLLPVGYDRLLGAGATIDGRSPILAVTHTPLIYPANDIQSDRPYDL